MLQKSVDVVLYQWFALDPELKWAQALNFFLYDTIKIIVMLFIMISLMGFLRSFFPQHKIKKWLSGKGILGNIFASLFGAVTPFCSCSSIPIFFGFLEAEVPLGVTFSFLITSPLINEYLAALMFGFFGWKITVLYIISGLVIGIVGGIILGKMNLDKYIAQDIVNKSGGCGCGCDNKTPDFRDRINYGLKEATSIVKKIWLWVILGVGFGAFTHNYVPQEFVQSIISKTGPFSVPIATLIGVPMYGSCAAIVPIAVVFFKKGVPLGTALAFMMATAALSLSEAIILKRAMKLKLIVIFFAITSLGILFTGYMFNFLETVLK